MQTFHIRSKLSVLGDKDNTSGADVKDVKNDMLYLWKTCSEAVHPNPLVDHKHAQLLLRILEERVLPHLEQCLL